jgi:hypothetical protein
MRCSILSFALATILATASIGLATTIHVPADQPTIQAGIDAAVDGDTVLVADGTYTGSGNRDISFGGKAILVTTENGPELTLINCEGSSSDQHIGFYFSSGEDTLSVLEGFTVINGYRSGYHDGGGAAYFYLSSPAIKNCIFSNNFAGRGGGGAFQFFNSSPVVSYCIFSGNSTDEEGIGGAVRSQWGAPVFRYCTFVNNTTYWGGGAIAHDTSAPILINCTIAHNTSVNAPGGAIAGVYQYSHPSLTNCILWDNHPDEIHVDDHGDIDVAFSDVEGGWEGEGNINADPLFMGGDPFDYHLTENSPCIDAGDPASPPDADGTRTDMGAYYFDQSAPPEILTIEVEPDTTYYHKGDILGFTVTITNNTDTTVYFQGWSEGETPWGLILSPLLGPINVVLGPHVTVHPHISQQIPKKTPYGGPYIYRVKAGEYPDSVLAEDSFEFYVVPPGVPQRYGDWEVVEGANW